MKINHLDLFSGIGGFHKGFQQAGYKVNSYFSEIDKHAIAVYKNQFKDAEYVGSVVNLKGDELPRIDLVTFGSPCQDFSLAGKRKGMSGDRSSLVLEAIRLISECRPGVFIWENVKGTFSSNSGEDFAAILQAFTNIGGYRLEWQLLNTANYLPQNRERIYLVGYSTTTKRNWRGVFPIGESSRKSNELEGQQGIANCLHTKYQNFGNGAYIGERKLKKDIAANQAVVQPNYEIVKQKVWVRKHKVDIEGLQDLLRSHKNKSNKEISEALKQPITKVEHWFRRDKAGFSIPEAELWNDLKALLEITTTEYDAQVTEFVEQDGKYDQAERVYNTEGLAPTLTLAQEVKIKDIAANQAVVQPNYTYTKVNETIEKNPNSFKEGEVMALDFYNQSVRNESPCLTDPKHNNIGVFNGYRIRRLTPIECERLQGFPDNHTSKGIYDGEVKKMSNTQRYKQCGNAVTVDVVQAIAEKIKPLFK